MIATVGSWYCPCKTPTLGSNEVHVWQVSLNECASKIESLQQTLCMEEKKRSERFYFQGDRENFIVARGLLREILSRYLGSLPRNLRFCYSSTGKPALTKAFDGDRLRFNLSHSHGCVLYAITQNRDIGIDIERIRTDFSYEQIASSIFSLREKAVFFQLPILLRHQAFFNCFTRKEAYIKATGQGLSLPLEQIDVTLVPGEPADLLGTKWNPLEAWRWSLQDIFVDPNYAAAVAVEGDDWQLKCWQYSELKN